MEVFSDQIKILPPHNNGSEYFRKKHSNFNVDRLLEIQGFELIPKILDYVDFSGFTQTLAKKFAYLEKFDHFIWILHRFFVFLKTS